MVLTGKENDTAVGLYLRTASRFHLLSREEEIELANKIRPGAPIKAMRAKLAGLQPATDEEVAAALKMPIDQMRRVESTALWARNKLVNHNLRLVVAIAKKYPNKGLPIEDLIGEGKFGLILAAEKFDPARGCKFSTHAHWWIRQSITRAISNQSNEIRLPIHVSEQISKLRKAYRQLAQELMRTPTQKELANHLGWAEEKVYEVLSSKGRMVPFDALPPNVDDGTPMIDRFIDPNRGLAMDVLAAENQREFLFERMRTLLTQQEFDCLVLYFGLDGQEPRSTTKMPELGVNRSRVGRVKKNAMDKLKLSAQSGLLSGLKEARGVAG